VLRLLAVGLLAIALVRPQRMTTDASEVEGIDIVVALDVSQSMLEEDLLPNRITAAKRVIDSFISKRKSDRIGLVIFGSEAFTQCPLTLDTTAVRLLLSDVRIGLIDGTRTAIGNAIGTALNRLRKSTARSRVIVLVTDGEDNASKLDPRQAARYAQTFGVRVFTILIGRDVDEPQIPAGMDRMGLVATQAAHPVNPKLLEEISNTTGGASYLATDTEALDKRFQAILEDLERSRLRAHTPHYAELFPLFVAPAFAILLLEIALSLSRFRRFP
jgi:Ca-activated chloride channel family protein